MNVELLVYVIADVVLYTILILLLTEVFVFQKALQKIGINFVINIGKVVTKNQLIEILNLLESENESYRGQERRIIVYRYRWQFLPFYLIRLFLAYKNKQEELKNRYKNIMEKDSRGALLCAGYIDVFNIIEIYEFNFKKVSNNEGIDIFKIQLINAVAHEFRHRIQYINQISVADEERDAEEFAIQFCNKNKQKLKEILNLTHAITFKE